MAAEGDHEGNRLVDAEDLRRGQVHLLDISIPVALDLALKLERQQILQTQSCPIFKLREPRLESGDRRDAM